MRQLLLALLVMANPAFSRSASTPFVNPTSPQSVTIQVDAGDTVVVSVVSAAAASANLAAVTSIANGGSYSQVDTQTTAAGFERTEVWRTTAAGGGTSATTVQVSFSGTPASLTLSVETISNGGGYGLSAKATANSGTAAATVAMSSAQGLLVGGYGSDQGGTTSWSMANPNTQRSQNGTTTAAVDTSGAIGDNPSVGVANLTLTATPGVSPVNWAMVAFEITPAASGSTWPLSTKRPGKLSGPYDPRGFLLSPYKQYDYTPSVVSANVTVATDIGSLLLTGFVPVLNTAFNTGVASLTLNGFVPTLGLAFNAGVGSLTLSGFAPVLDSKLNTGLGQLTLSGFAPVLDSKLNTGLGVLTLSGFAPVLDSKLNTDVGSLVLGGFVSSVLIGTNIQTDFGVLTLVGLAPVLDTSIGTDLGLLTLAGFSPDIQGVTPPVIETPRTAPGGGRGRRARRVIEAPDLSNVQNLTELYRALNNPQQQPKIIALPVVKTDDESEVQEIIAVYFAFLDDEELN